MRLPIAVRDSGSTHRSLLQLLLLFDEGAGAIGLSPGGRDVGFNVMINVMDERLVE